MVEIFLWVLIGYGITNIVVFGKIFENFRSFFVDWGNSQDLPFRRGFKFIGDLISCPMCFGFWCGAFLSIIIYSPVHVYYDMNKFMSWFFDGTILSGAVWVIYVIVDFFEN